jgi:hypothetical protein
MIDNEGWYLIISIIVTLVALFAFVGGCMTNKSRYRHMDMNDLRSVPLNNRLNALENNLADMYQRINDMQCIIDLQKPKKKKGK